MRFIFALLSALLLSHSGICQAPYTEKGQATYYGDQFHNRLTASGERYHRDSFTAAHRTLPFGTKVKVSCSKTGRSCIVRINDRGPFTKGRIIDVSAAAAKQLGIITLGVADVEIQVMELTMLTQGKTVPVTRDTLADSLDVLTAADTTGDKRFAIQAGAFKTYDNALELKKHLEENGFTGVEIMQDSRYGVYKVLVGGYADRLLAGEGLKRLRGYKIEGFIVEK
ncbi:MAG: septal ring lytic transglycosylase RlpA family protein [Bacteroidota bacterium]|nr:septal ring lytic transglycosylase RlpA family protein [Bacteroidota bacterium]